MPEGEVQPIDHRYDALDECVKQYVSRKEFAWLPDEAKHTLVQELTEPDVVE